MLESFMFGLMHLGRETKHEI